MAKSTIRATGRASLCALGEYLRRRCFFAPLQEQVKIAQKVVKYRPIDKLLDGLLGILCGAKTIAQSRVTMKVDPPSSVLLGARTVRSSRLLRAPCMRGRPSMWSNWSASLGPISHATEFPPTPVS